MSELGVKTMTTLNFDAHHAFNRACKDAAAVWLEYNLPIITNNSEDKQQ